MRRCLAIATSIGANVYIPDDADLEEKNEVIDAAKKDGFSESQIVNSLPEKDEYSLMS